MRWTGWIFLLSLSCWAFPASAAVEGYYRQPALGADQLVFVSEGDLWRVSPYGGLAHRLTNHAEAKRHPALSPDGQWLAFTGRYDGIDAVYVMPASGGLPRRLSFESAAAQVTGWTPEGEVLYTTSAIPAPASFRVLRAVDPDTLDRRELPLMDARAAAIDENGVIYFIRFGLALTGDNAREYRGGAMSQLWRFDPSSDEEATRLAADYPGNLDGPMWWNGRLYLVGDANGGVNNLWELNPDNGELIQITFHDDFDVRSPSLYRGQIVYQHGADLRRLELGNGDSERLSILLATDRSQGMTRWLERATDFLESVRLAPEGDRLVLTARGQVAVAGTGALRRIDLGLPEQSRARQAVLSPDGDWVYAIVDASGEHEIWRFPLDGREPGEALTRDGDTQREQLLPSPDGRLLAHSDLRGRLWLMDLERGEQQLIDRSPIGGHAELVFSPDSRQLVLVRSDSGVQRRQLLIYDIESEELHTITSDRYESFSPAFTPDNRWLFFLSNRNFEATPASPWGDRNLGPMFDRRTRIYAYALQPGLDFPLMPRHELTGQQGAASNDGEGNDNNNGLPAIELAGLRDRLYEVPVESGNFSQLAAANNRLFLLDRAAGRGQQPRLRTLDFQPDRARLETFADGVVQLQLSADGSKLYYRRAGRGGLFIVDTGARPPSDTDPFQVRLDRWRLPVQPMQEWPQMFADAWRMQRDFLFDPAMRGQDWQAIRDKYEPLVARVGDRRELDDLLAQMAAELGVLHSQVRGGDYPSQRELASPAFLGGEFERVEQGARIVRIYQTDPELPNQRSPLSRPGVQLQVDDIITHVNDRAVNQVDDLSLLLKHQAGQQVRLDVLREGDSIAVVVEPISAGEDYRLRYQDWVHGRRGKVEAVGEARLGYLHLHAMGPNDIADFAREFYANFDREGLIIDVRRNRGGNIDSWIIEKLLRRAWMFWQRPGQEPFWNMQQTFRGHLVVLMDELTYSDGETFSAGVKALELGPLIGQRSAGAGVWLSDTNRLVDQGLLRAAQLPQYTPDGRWMIEGRGVAPDIEVLNPPHATWRGEDAQLDAAIQHLLQRLDESPLVDPQPEPIPPRGQDGFDMHGLNH
ncbi:MAG: S41 family peptidase [Wenzhouxiangella sp.]